MVIYGLPKNGLIEGRFEFYGVRLTEVILFGQMIEHFVWQNIKNYNFWKLKNTI